MDISEEIADIIDQSWARPELIPPHHIYVKMAYHLSQEARDGIVRYGIPKDSAPGTRWSAMCAIVNYLFGVDVMEEAVEICKLRRGIKKAKDSDSISKLLSAYTRKADEGELGRLLVEMVILHTARTQQDGGNVLKEAAEYYKVDTDAIALKVKQEFAFKEKARIANKYNPKPPTKAAKKSTAA